VLITSGGVWAGKRAVRALLVVPGQIRVRVTGLLYISGVRYSD
jgi:hypothetical protein